MSKRIVRFLICAALVLALSVSAAAAEGSGLIGVCMQNMSSSISELEAEALRATFEPLGYEVQVVSADDSVSAQVQQVQSFILMQAEMLVVLPCQIETLEDSLLEAREEGIKVVISGGTGSISEDAYDAVSADDEYMIGMYVAAVAKTWIEQNMDPDGDWDVAFISSTISDDATMRCLGEAQIVEPWLRNAEGEYVTLMGEVVDEAHEFDLMDDGTCRFLLPGNPMITDVYAGTYTIDEDGVTVHIAGLANVDPASPYKTPGLWSYIDGATGDATIVIDTQAHTFTAK